MHPTPAVHEYCAKWTAGLWAFNTIFLALGEMQLVWYLILTPTLGILLGRRAHRIAQQDT